MIQPLLFALSFALPGLSLSAGRHALISIADTGHGLAPELMGKIFEPYFTTKENGKGAGLGLAVVYGIVKEHGGEIKLISQLGKGSTFGMSMPKMVRKVLDEDKN